MNYWIRYKWAQFKNLFTDKLPWFIAFHLPRKVVLFAFIRVYATLDSPGPDYENAYNRWEGLE